MAVHHPTKPDLHAAYTGADPVRPNGCRGADPDRPTPPHSRGSRIFAGYSRRVPASIRSVTIAMALAATVLLGTAGCGGPSAEAEAGGAASGAQAQKEKAAPRPQPSTQTDAQPVLSAAVQRQIDYVLTYWKNYNTAEYGVLGDNDCVNFASQSLIQRGWTQDDDWYHASDIEDSSDTWLSSTAMHDWLETRPDLATPLDDSQRDQVKVGDIVQFDWDRSGDRDHTGIVTRVTHTDAGTQIAFAGHTEDSDYRDVDEAITVDHPGGAVYYWSVAG